MTPDESAVELSRLGSAADDRDLGGTLGQLGVWIGRAVAEGSLDDVEPRVFLATASYLDGIHDSERPRRPLSAADRFRCRVAASLLREIGERNPEKSSSGT